MAKVGSREREFKFEVGSMQQNMQNIISDVLFAEQEELHNMQNIINDHSFCRT
jgi:hypothetical protein